MVFAVLFPIFIGLVWLGASFIGAFLIVLGIVLGVIYLIQSSLKKDQENVSNVMDELNDDDQTESFNIEIKDPEPLVKKKSRESGKRKYTRIRKLENDYVVIDFETTGLSKIDNEIIQIGAVKYQNDIEVDSFERLVKPSVKLSKRITSITGITDEDLEGCDTIETIIPEFMEFIKDQPIIAHNASFDMGFLIENIEKCGIELPKYRVADTLSLSRKNINGVENHKLETLKNFLEIEFKSHDAISDCRVTGALYIYIKKHLPNNE